MAEGRTYRRTPEDVEEARHIHALVKKDLETRVLELSQAGQLTELHKLLGYEARWKGIVADLAGPMKAKTEPAPAATDATLHGSAPEAPSVSPDKVEGSADQRTAPGRNRTGPK